MIPTIAIADPKTERYASVLSESFDFFEGSELALDWGDMSATKGIRMALAARSLRLEDATGFAQNLAAFSVEPTRRPVMPGWAIPGFSNHDL